MRREEEVWRWCIEKKGRRHRKKKKRKQPRAGLIYMAATREGRGKKNASTNWFSLKKKSPQSPNVIMRSRVSS